MPDRLTTAEETGVRLVDFAIHISKDVVLATVRIGRDDAGHHRMTRRIKHLDTPEGCRKECAELYRRAWKGEIGWADAHEAAEVLGRLFNMNGGSADTGAANGEAKWNDVGKNALHR